MLPAGVASNFGQMMNVRPRSYFAAESFHHAYHQASSQQYYNLALYRSPIVVMKLTRAFLASLKITSRATHLLNPFQGEHIWQRHKNEANAIHAAMPMALNNLRYIGRRFLSRRIEVTAVGECAGGRLLLVGFKFVPARRASTKGDEALVKTAYFVDDNRIAALVKQGQLKAV
jgi:hypothetical protein